MKILVAMKRVLDYKAIIRLKADGRELDLANAKMSINPFDEIAIEEAVRLKEKKFATEIIVVSIGTEACQESLRTALAMGADRGILIKTTEEYSPLTIAKILQTVVHNEQPQLILLGKQAIDSDDNQVGQMLAGLLDYAQGCFTSRLECQGNEVEVTREVDGGLEKLALQLPAVITTDLRLNEPRYISLPNIVQAKRKPIDVIPIETLSIDSAKKIKTINLTQPEKKRARIQVNNAAELIDRLKNEAQVIS